MQLPKLQPRPRSTQTVLNWRGLERRPGAGIGWWKNERNLSSDRAPLLGVRKGRSEVQELDGNSPGVDVVGMAGGDRAVLMDVCGRLWCGGHSVWLNLTDGVVGVRTELVIHNLVPTRDGRRVTTIAELEEVRFDGLEIEQFLGVEDEAYDLRLKLIQTTLGTWKREDDPLAGTWTTEDLLPYLYGMGMDPEITVLPRTAWIELHGRSFSAIWADGAEIIRSGALAIALPEGGGYSPVWCDAVKLASGAEMVQGTDYGWLDYHSANSGNLTLTLCDIDGNPYPNLTVGSTEPMTQSGYWLDTSAGGTSVHLRMWSVTTSSWIQVEGTYVKISPVELVTVEGMELRAGDGVRLAAELPAGTDQSVVDLLNSSHYIYGAGTDPVSGEDYIVVAGILPADTVRVSDVLLETDRKMPEMDFVVACGNRLWGCRYSEQDGINEIYCSALGDPRNWEVYQGLSTDSWRASRGTAAPFTGAAVLDGHPLFFREESLEKVYPSASGAHQIQEFDLEGVQAGSSRSLVVIEDKLFYKGRQGVMVYTGSLPQRISPQFGDWMFTDASAARAGRKYCVAMTATVAITDRRYGEQDAGGRIVAVYDLATGDWHIEDEAWAGLAITWEDNLYYTVDGQLWQREGADSAHDVDWWAETGPIDMELPEHKWITCLRLRFSLELGSTCRVYISHDDGPWLRKGSLTGSRLHSRELGIWPRRCDHFRLRLEGRGGFELRSLSFRLERSELGH